MEMRFYYMTAQKQLPLLSQAIVSVRKRRCGGGGRGNAKQIKKQQ